MQRHHKLASTSRASIFYLVLAIVFLILIPVWSLLIAPPLKAMPDNFSYSANILSLDNFYDEDIKQFEGEHISKTMFSYSVIAKHASTLAIKNSFSVFKLSNKPIFSVSRIYFIDPYNEKHVNVAGEENRNGYLFAPHYADKKSFTYWHINYDAPAEMKFVNAESIDGLMVYHYEANYHSDQTANLGYLPGVPAKRGVKTNIRLQLWIEPVSGWLVKYQDNTLAYFYDRKTGATLSPWNKFSNRYTQNSIHEQIQEAKKLKTEFLLIDLGVPFILIILAAFMLWNLYLIKMQRSNFPYKRPSHFKIKSVFLSYAIYFLLSICIIGSLIDLFCCKNPRTLYKIGISQWNDNPELKTAILGFKDGLKEYGFNEGNNLTFFLKNPDAKIENQIDIIQSFVHDNVNVIFTLTTQGTLVAKGITTQIPIVFADVMYPDNSDITSNTANTGTNLVGTRNYISPARQFYAFERLYPHTKILGFVHRKGDPDSEIQLEEYKAMLNKRNIQVIDIAAINQDDLTNALQRQRQQHYDSLFIACDSLIRGGGGKIAAEFSLKNKIPSFSCDKNSVENGALVGYFADLYAISKIAGKKAALILRGAEPDWLETATPKHGYLIINLPTAKILGITVTPEVEQEADEIIRH